MLFAESIEGHMEIIRKEFEITVNVFEEAGKIWKIICDFQLLIKTRKICVEKCFGNYCFLKVKNPNFQKQLLAFFSLEIILNRKSSTMICHIRVWLQYFNPQWFYFSVSGWEHKNTQLKNLF